MRKMLIRLFAATVLSVAAAGARAEETCFSDGWNDWTVYPLVGGPDGHIEACSKELIVCVDATGEVTDKYWKEVCEKWAP